MIPPLHYQVHVKVAPARAFELFVTRMAEWWPAGRTIGQRPHLQIVVEARDGGLWFERDADGNEVQWGRVILWEPPHRLLLDWQINTQWQYDPALHTEVELGFAPHPDGGTLVTLEHRHLERFGTDAAAHVHLLGGGWPTLLAGYAGLVSSSSSHSG